MNKTLEDLEKAIQHLANYQNPSITRSDQKESLAKCWWALHELRDSLEFLNDKNNSETIEKPNEKRYYLKIEVLAKNSQSMNEGLKIALSEIEDIHLPWTKEEHSYSFDSSIKEKTVKYPYTLEDIIE